MKDETDLASVLKSNLKEQFKEVCSNINLASYNFYKHWKKWFGPIMPPAQPQIDLLLVDSRFQILAVELKYFRIIKKARVNYPFYDGIEEALALLRFGFLCVSLWHCFDVEVPISVVSRYTREATNLINALNLPIEYRGILIDKSDDNVVFKRFSAVAGAIYVAQEPELPSCYGKLNPLKSTEDSKKMLDFLRSILRIPTPST